MPQAKVGVLQLQTLWPFADKEVAQALRRRRVVVAEMNFSLASWQAEVMKCVSDPRMVSGVNTYNGSIMTPAQIVAAL